MLPIALLLSCAPHPVPPAGNAAPHEAEARAACASGQSCLPLVAVLETEAPSPARIREGVDLAMRTAEQDIASAQVAVLITSAHPDVSTAEERATAWRRLCEVHGFASACAMGARALAVEQPAVAASLSAAGCERGLPHLCASAPAPAAELPAAFTKALTKVGATFDMPAGFHVIPPPEDRHFPADLALLSDDGRLEIRYMLSDDTPLLREVAACKDRPGCVSADGLRIQQSMPVVALANVVQTSPDKVQIGKMPPLAVRLEFNAHWGITGSGLLDTGSKDTSRVMSLVFVHQDPGANLYILYVFHDPMAMTDLEPVAFHALRFATPPGLAGSWL